MKRTHRPRSFGMARPWLGLLWWPLATLAAVDVPKVPVPASPYLPVIYRFADAMVENGRDTYGPVKTGLFLSPLQRSPIGPYTNHPPVLRGIVDQDRVGSSNLAGANPQHDQNLLRLLYTLSELSGRPKYREAADGALKWVLEVDSGVAGNLLAHRAASWDVLRDAPLETVSRQDPFSRPEAFWYRPWMLWERSFVVAPEASARLAAALIGPEAAPATPAREGGFYARAWAVAYRYTTNQVFLKAVEAVLAEHWRANPARRSAHDALSLAIDCDGAAHYVGEPLAGRLRELARRNDEGFLSIPHNLDKEGGFRSNSQRAAATVLWGEPLRTTARVGMMCVSRYENTGQARFGELVHDAADAYFRIDPSTVEEAWPVTVGQVISLQLAAWRSTAQPRYLERARAVADWALQTFFDAPLPRAGPKSHHYEAVTGTDTLALALVELHLNILGITAVQCPANTIDR